jgi:Uma2 family endonuclease
MAPATEAHGALKAEVGALLGNHLVGRSDPGRVIAGAGIVPRVRSDWNYRVSDLAITRAPPSSTHMVAEPILLVEILASSDEVETWANIWAYTTLPSVIEIVIVSSNKVEADLLRRRGDGSWPEIPERIEADGELRLESIDFTVPLRDVYRTTVLASG